MKFGDFHLHFIQESIFRLDAGALFGVVPQVLWKKHCETDDLNRVTLACNLLLMQTETGNVLVETGMGPRWSKEDRQRYALQSLVDHENVFSSIGIDNSQIDAVVISHLHFDHAGGAVIEKDGKLQAAFPNAKYYSQRGEFQFAQNCNSRARASYRSNDFLPLLEEGKLVLLDGDAEILPGVRVHVSGGHTCHHQIVSWESRGKKGIYFADILPTKAHLQPAWVMGFDHYPLDSCDQKQEWLSRAAAENWLVVFDHELETPWGHVQINEKGKFSWHPLEAVLSSDN